MKFTFTAAVTVSAYTVVEADNEQEARDIIEERSVELGGVGTGADPDECWVIEEGDGAPSNVRLEEQAA